MKSYVKLFEQFVEDICVGPAGEEGVSACGVGDEVESMLGLGFVFTVCLLRTCEDSFLGVESGGLYFNKGGNCLVIQPIVSNLFMAG